MILLLYKEEMKTTLGICIIGVIFFFLSIPNSFEIFDNFIETHNMLSHNNVGNPIADCTINATQ